MITRNLSGLIFSGEFMQSVREYHRELRMDFESEMEEDIKSIQLYTTVICPLQNYAVSGSILLQL